MLFAFLGIMLEKRGLTAMRIRPTLLRAEQSRAWANCALFSYKTTYIREG